MRGFLDNLVQKAKVNINQKLLDLQYGKELISPLPQDEYQKKGMRKVVEDGSTYYINPTDMSMTFPAKAQAQEPAINSVEQKSPLEQLIPSSPWDEDFVGPKQAYRHPNWNKWKQQSPKSFDELLSGTRKASEQYGVPQDLLMDIAGIESSGGQIMDQLSGGPGKGYYQFENPESGYNPYSATESAQLAAKRIKNKQLSNWGTPGGNWGSLDASIRDPKDRLSSYYTPEELNKYLVKDYQFKQ